MRSSGRRARPLGAFGHGQSYHKAAGVFIYLSTDALGLNVGFSGCCLIVVFLQPRSADRQLRISVFARGSRLFGRSMSEQSRDIPHRARVRYSARAPPRYLDFVSPLLTKLTC